MKKKTIILVVIVALMAVGGFFVYRQIQNAQAVAASLFQTDTVARGSLVATVGATGTVRANQTTLLTWQTTGTLASVDVNLGDRVSKGQLLARLDKSSLPQNVILAEADLVTAQRNLDNLKSSSSAIAQAQQNMAQAQKAVDDAQTKYEGLAYPRGDQTDIDNAQSNYDLAVNRLAQAQSTYERVANYPDGNVIKTASLNSLTAAQIARDQALANLNWIKGKPTSQDISIAAGNLAVAKAQLQDAQREWDRLKNGPDPQDVAAAQARVDAIQATLNLDSIVAPFDATVTEIDLKPGDQVGPGTVMFRLDDLAHLLVDVQVSEIDINNIKPGQDVSLTFDAINGKEYSGKVTQVANVGSASQGTVNFTVTVELLNPDQEVRPAMTAAVNMVVNQINDALLVPNRAVRIKNNQRVVYILRGGQSVAANVELGASSDTMSEVLSGDVQAGDTIILNPPAEIQPGSGGIIMQGQGGG